MSNLSNVRPKSAIIVPGIFGTIDSGVPDCIQRLLSEAGIVAYGVNCAPRLVNNQPEMVSLQNLYVQLSGIFSRLLDGGVEPIAIAYSQGAALLAKYLSQTSLQIPTLMIAPLFYTERLLSQRFYSADVEKIRLEGKMLKDFSGGRVAWVTTEFIDSYLSFISLEEIAAMTGMVDLVWAEDEQRLILADLLAYQDNLKNLRKVTVIAGADHSFSGALAQEGLSKVIREFYLSANAL